MRNKKTNEDHKLGSFEILFLSRTTTEAESGRELTEEIKLWLRSMTERLPSGREGMEKR